MRVISNTELAEVSGAGWWDDLLEAIGFGSSSGSSYTCTANNQTNGSTSSTTTACSNGVTTVTTIGQGYTSTTIITPGTNASGEIGYRMIGANVTYTAQPNVCVTTVVNGNTSINCR